MHYNYSGNFNNFLISCEHFNTLYIQTQGDTLRMSDSKTSCNDIMKVFNTMPFKQAAFLQALKILIRNIGIDDNILLSIFFL